MAKAELEIGLRFEGAVVRPGDTLVLLIQPPSFLTDEQRAKFRALAEADLPGIKVLPVEGVAQALVYRPDDGRTLLPPATADADRLIGLFPDVPASTWEQRDLHLWRTQANELFIRDSWRYVLLGADRYATTEAAGEFIEDCDTAETVLAERLAEPGDHLGEGVAA